MGTRNRDQRRRRILWHCRRPHLAHHKTPSQPWCRRRSVDCSCTSELPARHCQRRTPGQRQRRHLRSFRQAYKFQERLCRLPMCRVTGTRCLTGICDKHRPFRRRALLRCNRPKSGIARSARRSGLRMRSAVFPATAFDKQNRPTSCCTRCTRQLRRSAWQDRCIQSTRPLTCTALASYRQL